jgi:hypothetical protein
MHYNHSFAFCFALFFSALLLAGCGRREMVGKVQSSRMTDDGYQLSFSSSDSSDYVFVQTKALVGTEIADYLHAQNDTNSLIRLGTQYIGWQIRVAGHTQRDQAGKRFILVTNRFQITLVR